MTDFKQAMRDPKSCFDKPNQILVDTTLSKEEKIKILKQWEYSTRELSIAEEENMLSHVDAESSLLKQIQIALRSLGIEGN